MVSLFSINASYCKNLILFFPDPNHNETKTLRHTRVKCIRCQNARRVRHPVRCRQSQFLRGSSHDERFLISGRGTPKGQAEGPEKPAA